MDIDVWNEGTLMKDKLLCGEINTTVHYSSLWDKNCKKLVHFTHRD